MLSTRLIALALLLIIITKQKTILLDLLITLGENENVLKNYVTECTYYESTTNTERELYSGVYRIGVISWERCMYSPYDNALPIPGMTFTSVWDSAGLFKKMSLLTRPPSSPSHSSMMYPPLNGEEPSCRTTRDPSPSPKLSTGYCKDHVHNGQYINILQNCRLDIIIEALAPPYVPPCLISA